MKKLSEIDAFVMGRKPPSDREREKLRQQRLGEERDAGYQKLLDLCAVGEYEAARILADKNFQWGYQIVGKEVIERED